MLLTDAIYSIIGFLSAPEADLLYTLASQVPHDGHIVEIGSYQGKSTVCLGLGAKQSGATVWAIDPHTSEQVNAETHYGMENYAVLLKNLVEFDVAQVVRVLPISSGLANDLWYNETTPPIDLLWIDGSHKYRDAYDDLNNWHSLIRLDGKIAMHDTSGHFPDVTRALRKFLSLNKWHISSQVDSITVLETTL